MENQTTAPPDPVLRTTPEDLLVVVPRGLTIADDYRQQVLTLWINEARTAGYAIAEFLSIGDAELDRDRSRHCGTARIGRQAFDVYVRIFTEQEISGGSPAYATQVENPNRLVMFGLDQPAPVVDDQAAEGDHHNWVTRTAAELAELVERARNLLHTNVGNDVERDAVRDQADMLEIVAALLPAWADRGVHPATEDNVEMAAARLTHLVDELGG